MNDDEIFQFNNQWNADNYREEEEALRRREEEERQAAEAAKKAEAPKVVAPAAEAVKESVAPVVNKIGDASAAGEGSAAVPQRTGQPAGEAGEAVVEQPAGEAAGTVVTDPAEISDGGGDNGDSFEFDVLYRGSRSAESASMGAGGDGTWGSLMTEPAVVGGTTDGAGTVAGGEKPEAAAVTTGVGSDWGDDPEQTWDSFQRWLEKKDAQFQKQERNKAWWELMTRGLVGAANLYGTTQGAPSLDLSGSKDAFNSKDSYARLQNEKTQMYNLVNRRIEQMQKEKNLRRQYVLAEGKVKESETKIKNMEKEIERKQKESDAKVDLLLKQGKTAEAQQEKVAQEAARKQMENSVWMEKYNLEKAKTEADIAARYAAADRSRAAAAKDRNGGGSGSGKGKTFDLAGSRYTLPTNGSTDFVTKAHAAGIQKYENNIQKIIDWVNQHPDDEKTKKFKKALGID